MYVNVPFKVVWQFTAHPDYKITMDKQVINCKTKKLLKYHERGFFIKNRYYKRGEINDYVEKIPKEENLPF